MVEIHSCGGLNAPHKSKKCVSLSLASVCFSLLFNFYLLLSLHPALKTSPTSLVRSLRGKVGYGSGSGGAVGVRRRLAVVVPTHAGDLDETLKSLEVWPRECTSDTLEHVDLVIYKAEPKDEVSEDEILTQFRETAGTCFARTRMVYGELTKEVRACYVTTDNEDADIFSPRQAVKTSVLHTLLHSACYARNVYTRNVFMYLFTHRTS